MIFPFAYIYTWIWVSTYVHPALGIFAMYSVLITTIAVVYKITSRKLIKVRGSYEGFKKAFTQLYGEQIETQQSNIERKRNYC